MLYVCQSTGSKVMLQHRYTHTVSLLRPNTDALDRIVLSMKLSMYVMKSKGIKRKSTLRNSRRAIAAPSLLASKAVVAVASKEVKVAMRTCVCN